MVSREDHCLSDLLWRWRSGELGAEVVAVISNHDEHGGQVESLGLPFHHVPVEPAPGRGRDRILELLGGVDLLVLARYMQILSASSCSTEAPAINIHHSFLPPSSAPTPTAAPTSAGQADRRHRPLRHRGARRRADHRPGRDPGQPPRRGRGPERIGRDIERLVLARAVKAHLEDRVLLDGARTIVF